MNPVFYTPPDRILDESLTIQGEEAHHIFRVMRLRPGTAVTVVDGEGNGYGCTIEKAAGEDIVCTIYNRIRSFGEPLHAVTLAAGLSTGFKFDEVIERGTELGVVGFIPLITEKSRVRPEEESSQRKRERWRKVAIAAMKQTRRSLIPEIMPPIDFSGVFSISPDQDRILLFDPSGKGQLFPSAVGASERRFLLLVGPEAGFSPAEIEMAADHGAEIISLGPRLLRTENAGPAIAAVVMNLLGELR